MSEYVAIRDGGKSSEEGLMKPWYRLFSSGVPLSNSFTSLQVVQRAAGANMSVDVSIGDCALATTGYFYWGWTDAVKNVTITAADPTNPRIDSVVAYVDLSVVSSASNNNIGALKFVAIAGTAAASPAVSSDATIQAAVGAGNPFVKLASVAVATLAGNIVNANITDIRSDITYKGTTASAVWTNQNLVPSSITALGNRSYSVVYPTSVATYTSAGMRKRYTRTVAAPTYMGGAFNGTTQYFTKVTPGGALGTVVDNFTLMAYVEPTAYQAGGIAFRSDATNANGLDIEMNAAGQVLIVIRNGGATNLRYATTYQSLPLNKKTHVAATYTSTATTFVIYFDGVSVPFVVTTGGTAPTTAGLGGDFAIGRYGANNAGYFAGYVSGVGAFNAVLSNATILSLMGQVLSGAETNCIGAWSLNNTANDQNAAANNLTAQGSVGFTQRSPYATPASGVPDGLTEFGIVANVSANGLTETIQVPEACALPTTGGISAVSYSGVKAPYGMPVDSGKWQIITINRGANINNGASTADTYYNVASYYMSVPIGQFKLKTNVCVQSTTASAIHHGAGAGIGTSAGNFRDIATSTAAYAGTTDIRGTAVMEANITNSAATTYYINIGSVDQTTTALYLVGITNVNTFIAELATL